MYYKSHPCKMKVAFFHIACMGDYRNIVDELLSEIVSAGLDTGMDLWYIFACGGNKKDTVAVLELFARYSFKGNYRITEAANDFEFPTLNALYDHCCKNQDDVVLYFHTKGASRGTINNKYWRRAMSYYVLGNWQECLGLLQDYDAVGYNWRNGLFAGNFWWSNARVICRFAGFEALIKDPFLVFNDQRSTENDRMQAEYFWNRIPDLNVCSVGLPLRFDGVNIDPNLPIDNFDKDCFEQVGLKLDARWCINLDSRPDRWDNARIQFRINGIKDVKRLPAIPSRTMGIKSVSFDSPETINYAAIGCMLSHYFIISDAYQKEYRYILVTEDDVVFVKGFQEYFPEQYKYVPGDWDLIWVGGYERSAVSRTKNVKELVYKPTDLWGTHCYLLSKKGIGKLYHYLSNNPVKTHIDMTMSHLVPDLRQYSFHPPLANQFGFKSDIHE